MEMEKTAWHSATTEITPAATIQFEIVATGAPTRMTGMRTPDPDTIIHEGEEGVAAGTDNPTGAEEVVVK